MLLRVSNSKHPCRPPAAGRLPASRSLGHDGGTAPGLPAKLLPSLREHAAHLVGGLFTFVGFDHFVDKPCLSNRTVINPQRRVAQLRQELI